MKKIGPYWESRLTEAPHLPIIGEGNIVLRKLIKEEYVIGGCLEQKYDILGVVFAKYTRKVQASEEDRPLNEVENIRVSYNGFVGESLGSVVQNKNDIENCLRWEYPKAKIVFAVEH